MSGHKVSTLQFVFYLSYLFIFLWPFLISFELMEYVLLFQLFSLLLAD